MTSPKLVVFYNKNSLRVEEVKLSRNRGTFLLPRWTSDGYIMYIYIMFIVVIFGYDDIRYIRDGYIMFNEHDISIPYIPYIIVVKYHDDEHCLSSWYLTTMI